MPDEYNPQLWKPVQHSYMSISMYKVNKKAKILKRIPIKPQIVDGSFYLNLHRNNQTGVPVMTGVILIAGPFVLLTLYLLAFYNVTAMDETTVFSRHLYTSDAQNVLSESGSHSRCNESCNLQLVESIPWDMPYGPKSSVAKSLYQAWMELLNISQESIHMATYYWSLTGKDLGINDTSSKQGENVLMKFESLLSKNISVFIATSVPSKVKQSTDLEVLKKKGAHIKRINFGQLTHGVLHTKFWIVDRKHIFLGSANIDWRSLTQMKEVGVLITNCSCLANDLLKTFKTYWDLGEPNATIPSSWPSNYSTNINSQSPLEMQSNGTLTKAYFSASPSSFCPDGRTFDLIAILDVIYDAEEFIYVSVMEYFPTSRFSHPSRYWPPIDNALRTVALNCNIQIRLLINCWIHTDPSMFHFLKSLSVLSDLHTNVTIDVKIFIVPIGNYSNIPFARLSHNKYMVTDKTAYFGTSNWSEEYFTITAGVGFIAKQLMTDSSKRNLIIQEQLKSLFERDWNSKYAMNMEDLPGQKDCASKDGV